MAIFPVPGMPARDRENEILCRRRFFVSLRLGKWQRNTAMHLFVPYDDSQASHHALTAAYRMASPIDEVTAMAPVIIPAFLPVSVPVREVWRDAFRAEMHLVGAQKHAESVARSGDTLQCVRVHAYDRVTAIVAGAAQCQADTIVLAFRPREWAVSLLFGDLAQLLRRAPCNLQVLLEVPEGRKSRYLPHPHQPQTVVEVRPPFQQPSVVAVCNNEGDPQERIDEIIQLIRGDPVSPSSIINQRS